MKEGESPLRCISHDNESHGAYATIPGTAHPSAATRGGNYALTDTTLTPLMLKDFFDTKQDFFPPLIQAVQAGYLQQHEVDFNPFDSSPLRPSELQYYTIRPKTITFYSEMTSLF